MRLCGAGLGKSDNKPTITKTDEKKKIGDWNCFKMMVEQTGSINIKASLWLSEDIEIGFDVYLDLIRKLGMEKVLGGLAGVLDSIKGFPVLVETTQTQFEQTVSSTSLLKKVAKGPVDPALFKLPASYKLIEAGPLLQMQK